MWCANCQADVAAEASVDGRRLRCNACGDEVLINASQPANTARIRQARALLKRWSTPDPLDPFGPVVGSVAGAQEPIENESEHAESDSALRDTVSQAPTMPAVAEPQLPAIPPIDSNTQSEQQSAPAVVAASSPESSDTVTSEASAPSLVVQQPSTARIRFDRPHQLNGPHSQTAKPAASKRQPVSRSAQWVSTAGQLLAYGGIALLTVGSTLVVWGHFGDVPRYAPMGWLTATVGQMLLFLGIVTMISGTMEQSAKGVAQRLDELCERIDRIESRVESPVAPTKAAAQSQPAIELAEAG